MSTDERPFTVLFVCTANMCRSPLAEYLFRDGVRQRLDATAGSVEVGSAGTRCRDGEEMHPLAVAELRRRGIEAAGFQSRRLTAATIDAADLVLTAERAHLTDVLGHRPSASRRSFAVREFDWLLNDVSGGELLGDQLPSRGYALVDAAAERRGIEMAPWETFDVPDPIGLPPRAYEDCAALIDTALHRPTDLLLAPLAIGRNGR